MQNQSNQSNAAVSSVEVFGFLGWITSILVYVAVILWAFTPASVLAGHGITYYPSKYWAVAVPTWLCVTVIFVYWVYESLNMIAKLPSSGEAEVEAEVELAAVDKKLFSDVGDGSLPMLLLPAAVVRMVLQEGVPPKVAEELWKTEMVARSTEGKGEEGDGVSKTSPARRRKAPVNRHSTL